MFQLTFKGRVFTRSFEGSVNVGLSGQMASFLGILT